MNTAAILNIPANAIKRISPLNYFERVGNTVRLVDTRMETTSNSIAHVTSEGIVPLQQTGQTPYDRYLQQKCNRLTQQALDYIASRPNKKVSAIADLLEMGK